jgi:DNA-directed RNA polymerase specialized sigma24 family protein
VREVLTDDTSEIDDPDPASPDTLVIERERHTALHGAVERLSGRQRVLLSSMLATPAPTYEQLSTRLAMPIGSIGPTRDRALARLRDDPDLARAVAA